MHAWIIGRVASASKPAPALRIGESNAHGEESRPFHDGAFGVQGSQPTAAQHDPSRTPQLLAEVRLSSFGGRVTRNQFLAGVSLACAAARWPCGRARVLGWRQLEQDAKRDGESTAAAEDRARLAKVCLRLC